MRAAVEKGPRECRRELKERQKKDKGKELHPSKVRDTICCSECGRPRCIFAKTKPTDALPRKLDAYFQNVNYTCGDPLFPDGLEGNEKELADTFYISEALTCRNEMELSYFNYGGLRGRMEFEHVCARCGNFPNESPLVDKAKFASTLPQGKIPLPLCTECFESGKEPIVGRSDRLRSMITYCIQPKFNSQLELSHVCIRWVLWWFRLQLVYGCGHLQASLRRLLPSA